MKKKTQHHIHKFPIVLSVFVAITVLILYVLQLNPNGGNIQYKSQKTYSNTTSTYSSSSMKLNLNIPKRFEVEEKYKRIILNKEEKQIVIEINGTNFSDISTFVEDLEIKNSSKVIKKEKLSINGYAAIKEELNIGSYYFIYPDKWNVYIFSTSSPALFDDLDQIARSFRYTP